MSYRGLVSTGDRRPATRENDSPGDDYTGTASRDRGEAYGGGSPQRGVTSSGESGELWRQPAKCIMLS